jgi:nitrate/TMAO reductase-like tetraheme cytochrome c subunit
VGNVYQLYMDSIHGRALTRSGLMVAANCSDCHGAHEINPRTEPASRVHRANVPGTCGSCHAGILATFRQSIHGREAAAGNPAAPICSDCHTAHKIRRVEVETWKLDIVRECGNCHAESFQSYRDTFHGKVTALGFSRVARCSDCHGAHDVLPRGDPRSRVHPANLVSTCARCHPRANANFARYDPHADSGDPSRSPLLYYAARFMTWLLVGVFAFFGMHTTLWGVRALVAKRRHGEPPSEPQEPV